MLNDYMVFVEKIRVYNKNYSLKDAIDKSIDECIKEGILADILSEFKAEVRKMCITEFDEKVFVDSIRAEGKVEGKAEGKTEGQAELIKATQDARKGVTYEELINIYGEETAKNALLLK